ncbi:helix-turn-helix domain-containing protein [Pontibacter virosus]|uniref:Helix-turn-helix protein n=1 Tax=Pontibacter virosus TaxID=1765052 RepID=A0A2U1B427_9BACT|nr:helix-turn-helix domain-containing protein [Pontibacter virosus]PVY43267.1 helix-turn-helix protein [Pontibacter virosus]
MIDNPFAILERRLNRLETLLLDIKAVSGQPKKQDYPERLTREQALKFLGEQGVPISESHLYKLTAAKGIPFQKFNNKLVFSRAELLNWIETQTVDPSDTGEADLALAKSARRKKKGGQQYA